MIGSVSHVALVVKDPVRTAALFHELFGSRVITRQDVEGHPETFVRVGTVWLVLVGAPTERPRSGDHIAFQATPDILAATLAKLQAMGREYIRARSDRALYFFDYDNHVFELDTEDIDAELAAGPGG